MREQERKRESGGKKECFFFALSVVMCWCWWMIRGGISLEGGAQSLKRLLGQN